MCSFANLRERTEFILKEANKKLDIRCIIYKLICTQFIINGSDRLMAVLLRHVYYGNPNYDIHIWTRWTNDGNYIDG